MQPVIWNSLISTLPNHSILQTYQWGMVKAQFGWRVNYLLGYKHPDGLRVEFVKDVSNLQANLIQAAALVLTRSLRFPGLPIDLSMAYVPKGPMLDWSNVSYRKVLLKRLSQWARDQGAFLLKIDPDISLGMGLPGQANYQESILGETIVGELKVAGWHYSSEQVQFPNTVLLDLSPGENLLLARMKQKTRYNIRLAERQGVIVRIGTPTDIPLLYRMYAETALRDEFTIREEGYYRYVWKTFFEAGMAEPFIASYKGEDIAALILFYFGSKAWYLYGMSRPVHREKMPNYLLQWRAMQRAIQRGCMTYDLWGAPSHVDERDPLWGVYRFKEGLGGHVERTIGAWDLPLRPNIYWLFSTVLPRLLAAMRRRGQRKTEAAAGY